jgi:hypothetical protein
MHCKEATGETGQQATAAVNHTIQCSKLSVAAVNDPLEQEADAMADKVMRMPESFVPASFAPAFKAGDEVQRKCAHCEEEEKVQRKPSTSFIQRKAGKGGVMASDNVTQQINATKGGGGSMDSSTQSFMQSRFGTDFSNVKIHTGDYAVQMSRELNAQAFTVGCDIYFNSGKYNPSTDSGKHLLAHELTHTVQQGGNNSALIQKQDPEKPDKTFAPKLEIDYKLLPPNIQLRLFHFLLAADTSTLHLDYTAKSFMTGLSYSYGDQLSLNMKFNDFSARLGWKPGENSFGLGMKYGNFSGALSATPGQSKYGFNLHYGAKLLPFQDEMTRTFMAGGTAAGSLVGGLPGAFNDPFAYYQAHKTDIEDISKTAGLIKDITKAGESRIRFGAGLTLSYDPVSKLIVTGKIGFLF